MKLSYEFAFGVSHRRECRVPTNVYRLPWQIGEEAGEVRIIDPETIVDMYVFPMDIHSVRTIYHVNMMRCFQVIVLIYSSIYIQNRMAH